MLKLVQQACRLSHQGGGHHTLLRESWAMSVFKSHRRVQLRLANVCRVGTNIMAVAIKVDCNRSSA